MKECNQCRYEIQDSDRFCIKCGAAQSEENAVDAQIRQEKKKSKKKILIIAAAVVLLSAAVITFFAVWAFNFISMQNKESEFPFVEFKMEDGKLSFINQETKEVFETGIEERYYCRTVFQTVKYTRDGKTALFTLRDESESGGTIKAGDLYLWQIGKDEPVHIENNVLFYDISPNGKDVFFVTTDYTLYYYNVKTKDTTEIAEDVVFNAIIEDELYGTRQKVDFFQIKATPQKSIIYASVDSNNGYTLYKLNYTRRNAKSEIIQENVYRHFFDVNYDQMFFMKDDDNDTYYELYLYKDGETQLIEKNACVVIDTDIANEEIVYSVRGGKTMVDPTNYFYDDEELLKSDYSPSNSPNDAQQFWDDNNMDNMGEDTSETTFDIFYEWRILQTRDIRNTLRVILKNPLALKATGYDIIYRKADNSKQTIATDSMEPVPEYCSIKNQAMYFCALSKEAKPVVSIKELALSMPYNKELTEKIIFDYIVRALDGYLEQDVFFVKFGEQPQRVTSRNQDVTLKIFPTQDGKGAYLVSSVLSFYSSFEGGSKKIECGEHDIFMVYDLGEAGIFASMRGNTIGKLNEEKVEIIASLPTKKRNDERIMVIQSKNKKEMAIVDRSWGEVYDYKGKEIVEVEKGGVRSEFALLDDGTLCFERSGALGYIPSTLWTYKDGEVECISKDKTANDSEQN